jgi:hypothetical protein
MSGAAAPGAGQGSLQRRGDRRLPGAGGRAAHGGSADAGGRAGLPGRGRRADRRRPAQGARQRRAAPLRRRDRSGHRAASTRSSGPSRLPWPTARSGAVRRERPGHRRARSRPPEPDEPADQRTGRGKRAAPAGHVPAARPWLAGCAELLGLATFMRAAGIGCSQRPGDLVTGGWNPAARPTRCGCSVRHAAHDPASGPPAGHRCLRRRAADRGHAPGRSAPAS